MRMLPALVLATVFSAAAAAQTTNVRAKAEVECKPTAETLVYDCAIKLVNAHTGEPLSGVTVMVGADMPSMPMAHNVRPVKAEPGKDPGTYRVRIELEMYGDWAIRLDLSGPFRDRVIAVMRFAEPLQHGQAKGKHKH